MIMRLAPSIARMRSKPKLDGSHVLPISAASSIRRAARRALQRPRTGPRSAGGGVR
jgi:hypothetical protein